MDDEEGATSPFPVPGSLLMLANSKVSVGGVASCVERSQVLGPTAASFRGCMMDLFINGSVHK